MPLAGFRLSPGGNVPLTTCQVGVERNPLLVSCAVYDVAILPAGRLAGLMAAGLAMVIEKATGSEDCRLVAARTWKLETPAVVGVPWIAPLALFNESPAGSAPLTICQEGVDWKPLAVS